MRLSHRITIDPTTDQVAYFSRACGTARFVWNLALEEWERRFASASKAAKDASVEAKDRNYSKSKVRRYVTAAVEAVGGWPNANALKAEFNAQKYEAFPWLKGIHRDAHAQPFANLQKAHARCLNGLARRPRFKKKGHHDSFYVANDCLTLNGSNIRLPLIGWVRMHEPLRFQGKIISATVSRTADRWFISIAVEAHDPRPTKLKADKTPRRSASITPIKDRRPVVGVDLGLLHAAVASAGVVHDAPKPLKASLKKLRRLQRSQSRRLKVSGLKNRSSNWRKNNVKVARLHARIARIRLDFIHKLTTDLCRENQAVVIEDLNVNGMISNRRLSRAISDVGWGETRRQLEYKKDIYGTQLVVADRWLPSTKTCSRCGVIGPSLPLSERTFRCASCGLEIDRDLNAAINLEHYPGLQGNRRLWTGRIGSAMRVGEQPSLVEAGTAKAGSSPLNS